METQSRSLGRLSLALVAGILTGVALVTSYSFLEAWWTAPASGEASLLTPSDIAFAAFVFSLEYAVIITIICVPLWFLLSKPGWSGPVAAALLGFAATLACWMVSDYPEIQSVREGIPYSLCGAVAGFVIWRIGNRR